MTRWIPLTDPSRTFVPLLTALLLVVLGALPAAAQQAPDNGVADAPPVSQLDWSDCDDGLECATLPVPLDHTEPDGPTIDLALVRRPADDPDQRIGALFVNPGGPGGSAIELVRNGVKEDGAPAQFGAELRDHFDIVGFDPRGVGESQEVRCFSDEEREENLVQDGSGSPFGLTTPEERQDALDTGRMYAQACGERNDPEFLRQLSTENVARDMDLVRAALGEEQISYLGYSYGTFLGATYATLFPERLRATVLDSPADPQQWVDRPLIDNVEQAAGAEEVLNLYFGACDDAGDACPFGDGDAAAAFDTLLQGLEDEPIEVEASEDVPEGTVDGAVLLDAAQLASSSARNWPDLTAALLLAQGGDGEVLLQIALSQSYEEDGSPDDLSESFHAVSCMDLSYPDDDAAYDEQAAQLAEAAPRLGPSRAYNTACANWPVEPASRFTGPFTGEGAAPTLVVGSRHDPNTPYQWSERFVSQLSSARLLTADTVGHGVYGSLSPCVDAAVNRYLIRGELPEEGTVCAQEPAPTAGLSDEELAQIEELLGDDSGGGDSGGGDSGGGDSGGGDSASGQNGDPVSNPAPAPKPVAATSSGQLPFTGAWTLPAVVVGLLLLVGGAVALLLTRHRRQAVGPQS